jgi:hypothetical protein
MKSLNFNFEKLRIILEHELGRNVTIEEAIGTGRYLVNVYEILLINRDSGGIITDGHN